MAELGGQVIWMILVDKLGLGSKVRWKNRWTSDLTSKV